jgi:N-acetylneuraminic acid mutarotase
VKLKRLLAPACVFALAACSPSKKGEATAETAASAGEETPLLETVQAPPADRDIAWKEWAPAGSAAAELDWPSGAAYAGGSLYLVGTRAVGARGAKPAAHNEIVFAKLSPSGAEEVAAFPSPYGERAGAAAAAGPKGRVWFIGGMYTPPPLKLAPEGQLDFAEFGTPVGEVFAWKPGAKDLDLVTHLPVPRGGAAAFFHDGELYVVGGTFDPASPDDENNEQVHGYDLSDGLWTKYPEMRIPLERPAAAVAGGGLYVIGGNQLKPAHVTNVVFRYDLTVFKWQRMAPLPAPRAGAAAYVVGDYIYVVGGCEAEALGSPPRMAAKTYRYDLKKKIWEELPSALPEGCTLSAFDGTYFYLVGAKKTYRGRLVRVNK